MIDINGRLHSTEKNVNVIAGADEILDDSKNKKQSDINTETDVALEDRYTKSETYNKTELNNMITTPNQQYVSVTANSQTTAVTDVLPATGSVDTVYRVGNWDGSQFDASVYSEYAWNGSSYVHLSTKTKVGEVFDISAYHATGGELAKYADLEAALDSNNGGGVPQSLQEGGMTVKFVRTSDNNYVQARCVAQNFTTDITQWQGVDTNVTEGSKNLIESGAVKELFDSQYGNSRLDFSIEDEEGNSIVSVNDGHIKTKKFDSSKSGQSYDTRVEDFSVEDENNNSIVQFKDGHIRTKKFDSDKIIKEQTSVLDFEISDKNSSSVLVVKDGFPKTKNFNGKTVAENSSLSAGVINGNQSLYKTIIVNITDYNNNLVSVFNSIAPSEKCHYTVLIPEGTYNVNEWFSQDTITNSNTTGWRGLQLPNYIKLLGIGASDKIILQWLNPDSATHYNYISTFNTSHWQELENLTVKANNIRYAVHDDEWDGQDRYVRCKNCNFIVSGNTTRAWGGGTNGGYDGVFDHCKFIMEYYAPFENYTVNNYLNPMCLHDNYYNVGKLSNVVMRNCVFQNPYINLMYYWAESWEQITRDNSYPQYDNNKLDYAVNDCVNSPDDSEHSYKCIYANAQVPPCKKGRAGLSFGYGAQDATGVLYASIENCQFNTYFQASPRLERITGFGNDWGQEPILGRESDTSKAIIMDFRK